MNERDEDFVEDVMGHLKAAKQGEPYELTPKRLMKFIREFREANDRTIFVHPMWEAAAREFADGYEGPGVLTVVTSYVVPLGKILVMPTHVIDRPSWMT